MRGTRNTGAGRLGVNCYATSSIDRYLVFGLIVFFDDYANCLIVGSSMRPITDRLSVSRAKLAYLVDSTTFAPVATLALISTWVGYEVSLIDEAMQTLSPGDETSWARRDSAYGFVFGRVALPFYQFSLWYLVCSGR